MLADVFFQYNVMKAIGENSDTSIPNIPFVERTGAVLDKLFFLLDLVERRVPTDRSEEHTSVLYPLTRTSYDVICLIHKTQLSIPMILHYDVKPLHTNLHLQQ